MSKISVVINTINEEKNLPRALASIRKFADEIVVCDMYSDDNTVKLAKKAGAKVYKHKRTNYVEPARNYAIGKATGNWILVLDADEEIRASLKKTLRRIADSSVHPKGVHSHLRQGFVGQAATLGEGKMADYYRLPRKNIIFGKWIKHSRWWPDYNIRFFRKGFVEWSEIIHSVPTTQGKGLDLPVDEENAIVHYHYDSVEQYVDRMNRYTSLHAKNRIKEGYKFSWKDLVRKPSNEFLSRYFQGEGYKDGIHGLALASLQGFSELVLYLKIWSHSAKVFDPEYSDRGATRDKQPDLKKVVKLMKENEDDFHYWEADALLKTAGGVKKIKHRVKRKFKL